MSSDFREAQPRPIRADKDALSRAGNMGADGASPSKLPMQLVYFSLIRPIA